MFSKRQFFAALSGIAALVLLSVSTGSAAQSFPLEEGKNFIRLKTAIPVETGNKIEVLEFFSYGCPHCADLDPELQKWHKAMPADVQLRRVPVGFGREAWDNLGKAYYTLEALGEEARLTPLAFVAMHRERANLSNPKAFFDWAASKGVDRKKVEDMFNSFAINGKQAKANQVAKTYNVQSVPLIIVDGKFMTASDKVGSHANMPSAINALVDRARAERVKR